MNPIIAAMGAGACFALWSLVMSLSGLRSGPIAMMLLAGTFAVTAPWFLLLHPEPLLYEGRRLLPALLIGFGAACINGIGMILLPPLLNAAPDVVGTRILVLNISVVTVTALWTVGFGGQALAPAKIAGIGLAIVAVWLLSR